MFGSIENFSNNTALEDENNYQMTYDEICSFSSNLDLLIPKRSLILALCSNTIESIVGYISFIKNKTVPILVDNSQSQDAILKLKKLYEPEFIWMPKQKLEYFQNFEIVYSFKNYILIDLKSTSRSNLNENLALLLTTSGSTGSPKLVRLTYKNLSSNAESIIDYLKISKKDRPITTLPMSYSFGLSIINSHLIAGAKILVTSKSLMEKSFWDFLRISKATSMSGVPFTFEILKKLRFFKMETPYLKTLTQAGGKLNVDLLKEYADFCKLNNKDFYVMYGQTEATARISYVPPEKLLSKIGSIGLSIPGGSLSIVDENMQCIDDANFVGELKYSGPNVSMGYASSKMDLIKGDDNFGELLTGDLAKKDEDNFYFIVGRKKRFVKIYGNRVNLDELEDLIKAVVSDVACAGTDDNLQIYITDKKYMDLVKKYVTKKTGLHFKAFNINIIESIPKNLSGKTAYTDL